MAETRHDTGTRTECFLDEVFLSVQGEGIWLGERQLFVRLSGCGLDCTYCDSLRARRLTECAMVHPSNGGEPRALPNPVAGAALTDLLREVAPPCSVHSLSITGGEPLLQSRFLRWWLPSVRALGYRVYLETAGNLPGRLAALGRVWDFCSMDVKLPSATGMRSFIAEHRAFLEVCRGMGAPTMAKAVVTARTPEAEVAEAAAMIAATMPEATMVLQPMTATERTGSVPSAALMLVLQEVAMRYLDQVRVIPQTHRLAGIP